MRAYPSGHKEAWSVLEDKATSTYCHSHHTTGSTGPEISNMDILYHRNTYSLSFQCVLLTLSIHQMDMVCCAAVQIEGLELISPDCDSHEGTMAGRLNRTYGYKALKNWLWMKMFCVP